MSPSSQEAGTIAGLTGEGPVRRQKLAWPSVVESGRRSRPSDGGPLGTLPPRDVTGLLVAWCEGDQAAFDRLLPLVYAELRRVAHRHMRGERPDHVLQTTALVHEAWLRLVDVNRVHWQNRAHFFAVCAQMMRRILVNAARGRDAQKRGGAISHVAFDEAGVAAPERAVDVVALDDVLTAFAEIDPRKAKVVELRFFGGLSVEETAHVLQVSPETVMRDWKTAQLWLFRELRRDGAAAAVGRTL